MRLPPAPFPSCCQPWSPWSASFFMSGGVVLPNGKADDRRRRVTEVWVWQADGGWKEAHHHDSVFSSL
jgi:ketosteroid isomerase-like protein